MSVTLVNGHVLFALRADWKTLPMWSRTWQNQVAAAVTGAESRTGLRAQPRVKLEFEITPRTLAEQLTLHDAVMAARKSGLACVPYHGRGSMLDAEAPIGTSVEALNTFAWAVGDWLFLRHPDETVEVRELTAVALDAGVWTLDFAAALTRAYAAGTLVWPLLFGEFACDEMTALSPHIGPVKLRITELVAARTAQLGEEEVLVGDGIGVWRLEDDFVVQ